VYFVKPRWAKRQLGGVIDDKAAFQIPGTNETRPF